MVTYIDEKAAKIIAAEMASSRDLRVVAIVKWIVYCGVQLYALDVESRHTPGWRHYVTDIQEARDIGRYFRDNVNIN